ncbi:MOXD1 [Cordylochernes scorpioides]|uniref:MOXD1 n=1 Tax=Cordylochernes scorpioides TaxID=51811 RepID=A0ABY6K4B6_9ARAC|nr:MOXD1 [Cordylochernes scorpioides]
MDSQQDYVLLGGWENDTHTMLQFSRALETCDPDDMPIANDTIRVMYAWHAEDPDDSGQPKYHGPVNRGVRSIMLLQPQGAGSDVHEDSGLYWDALAPNYTLPSDMDTMYWCKILRSPHIPTKHHIYKVEPNIQPGNEGLVHHVILYHCLDRGEDEAEPYVDHPGHECHHPNMPNVFDWCEGVFAAWGIGGEVMHLPEHAGIPFGGEEERYFMLEVHYDNPAKREGVMDNSGLRIHYTPRLRTYDAATLLAGAATTPTVVIPPGQPSFVVAGHGDPRCLADGGWSTKEEMCLAFFLYYPRIARVASLTSPVSNLVQGLVGIKKMHKKRDWKFTKFRG